MRLKIGTGKYSEVEIATEAPKDEAEYAYILDEDGTPLAWYGGCGTHQLVLSVKFAKMLEQIK